MAKDSGPVNPLEQRCLRPGLWLIEGYEVVRITGSKPAHSALRRLARQWRQEWQVFGGKDYPLTVVQYLDEARDWIMEKRF